MSPLFNPPGLGLESSAAAFQPEGAAAAGSTGLGADAGHVHPHQLHQFSITAYGAVGDGQVVTDGAMSSSSNTTTLTCSVSAPFKSTDVGKAIMVKYALTALTGSTLVGTITGYTSSSVVTVSTACTSTVSNATVMWATDDTSAIQSAVNAAVTYAQAHASYAEVLVPPAPGHAYYGVAGALNTGVSGNAQITLPIVAPGSAKVTLVIKGGNNSAGVRYWDQTVPNTGGSCLVSFGVFGSASAQSTNISAHGNPSMIGGPTGVNGYGANTSPTLFSNMLIHLEGLTLLTTHSANGYTYGAYWFYGVATAQITHVSIGTTGVVLLTAGGGDFGTPSNFGSGISIGAGMPANGNNDYNQIDGLVINGGYTYGLFATEHTQLRGGVVLYCYAGLCPVGIYNDGPGGTGKSGNASVHGVEVSQTDIEACLYHLELIGAGTNSPMLHGVIDTEGTINIRDNGSGTPLGAAVGQLRVCGSLSTITTTFGTPLQLIKDDQPPGPVATPSFTLSTAQINTYWRPATVIVVAGTGSGITSIQVSALAGGASAPAMTTVYSQSAGAMAAGLTFRVGPGCWWAINATAGTAPTMYWVLD
jgi:hypothetical protein